MESIYVVCFFCFVVFSCLCFSLGFIIAEKKFRARLQWIKDSGLKKKVIYEVLIRGSIYSNIYAVVLRDGKNQEFGLLMADFELPKSKFVKLGDNWKLVPVGYDDKPAGDSQTPMFIEP
jgi:hypothetical protein